ncbi:MAG: hypothetical protein ACI4MJ_08770 [Aristaeellaceae bacterium]
MRSDLVSRQAAAQKPTATATPAAASSFPFTQTTQWVFSSGAGAWSTTMTLFADGTFTGYYSDWDAGDTDAGYPNGTHYESVFSGQFSNVTKVSDNEHRMVVTELSLDGQEGDIRLADGVRIMTQAPAGLSLGDAFSVYAAGTRQSAVPQEYFSWVYDNVSNSRLKNAALYNRSQECGFAQE